MRHHSESSCSSYTPDTDRLLEEFAPPSFAEWKKLVEEQLQGVPYEKKLLTKTVEGITLQPIYVKENVENVTLGRSLPGYEGFTRAATPDGLSRSGWDRSESLLYPTPEEIISALKADTDRGLVSIHVCADELSRLGLGPFASPLLGKNGTSLSTVDDFSALLDASQSAKVRLHLDAGPSVLAVGSLAAAAAERKGAPLNGSVYGDSIAHLATHGTLPASLPSLFDELACWVDYTQAHLPGVSALGIDITPYGDAGGSAIEELAVSLAAGVEYLRQLSSRGIEPGRAFATAILHVAIGSNFFMEIAKFRALRTLWGQVAQTLGESASVSAMKVFAHSGRWNKTFYAPFNNVLRATSETFAAILGGADIIAVAPHDCEHRPADAFSRRVARNVQIVLGEESHAHSVIDPAGGSWYVESLTQELCSRAWKLFQEIEAEGGILVSLQNGSIQKRITQTRDERIKRLNERRSVSIGSTMYVDLKETLPQSTEGSTSLGARATSRSEGHGGTALAGLGETPKIGEERAKALVQAASRGASLEEISKHLREHDKATECVAFLPERRLTSGYEALRAKANALSASMGQLRATILLFGDFAKQKPRADFCRTFLEPGGFQVDTPTAGLESPEAAARRVEETGCQLAVICGADDAYPALLPALVPVLKKARPGMHVILAGNPGDNLAAFKEAGLDDFIFVKSNNFEKLAAFQQAIEENLSGSR